MHKSWLIKNASLFHTHQTSCTWSPYRPVLWWVSRLRFWSTHFSKDIQRTPPHRKEKKQQQQRWHLLSALIGKSIYPTSWRCPCNPASLPWQLYLLSAPAADKNTLQRVWKTAHKNQQVAACSWTHIHTPMPAEQRLHIHAFWISIL